MKQGALGVLAIFLFLFVKIHCCSSAFPPLVPLDIFFFIIAFYLLRGHIHNTSNFF